MNIDNKIKRLNDKAEKYFNSGEYEKAIECSNDVLKIDTNNSEAYNNIGSAYYEKGNYVKAIKYLNKAIELNPNNSEYYSNIGSLYYKKDEHKKAIKHFNKSIKLDHNNSYAYNILGYIYNDKLEYKKAINYLNKAIELNLNDANLYNNRGNVYYDQGNYENAIKDLNKAIELNPNDANFYNNRGYFYYEQENYENAIKDLNKAIELNPSFTEAYFNYGVISYEVKKYKEAIKYLDKVIELNPSFSEPYLYKSWSCCRLKNYKNAMANLKELVHNSDYIMPELYSCILFCKLKSNRREREEIINSIINNEKEKNIDKKINSLFSYVKFDKNIIDSIIYQYKYINQIFDFNDPNDPVIKLTEQYSVSQKFLNKIRIACFTTNPLNILMYSHYSDRYKGLCIEYDFSDFIKLNQKGMVLTKVKYKSKIEIDHNTYNIVIKNRNNNKEKIDFIDLFRTKHKNWKYENEYRVITYDIDKIYLPIKAIYCGKEMLDNDIKLITDVLKGKEIKIYKVSSNSENLFTLDSTLV